MSRDALSEEGSASNGRCEFHGECWIWEDGESSLDKGQLYMRKIVTEFPRKGLSLVDVCSNVVSRSRIGSRGQAWEVSDPKKRRRRLSVALTGIRGKLALQKRKGGPN